MAKVTKSDLENLIENLLNEKISISGLKSPDRGVQNAAKAKIHPTLGIANIRKLAANDEDADTLSDEDFKNAYNYRTRAAVKRRHADVADAIRTGGVDSIRPEVEKIYQDSPWYAATAGALQVKANDLATLVSSSASGTKDKFIKFKEEVSKVTKDKKAIAAGAFKLLFSSNEQLALASYKAAGDSAVNFAGIPDIQAAVNNAKNERANQEANGSITSSGYTRYVTDKVKGPSALKYMPTYYNYTVIVPDEISVGLEPWFLADDDENHSAIESLMNNTGSAAKQYLDAFKRKSFPANQERADKIFIHNLKAFQAAIKAKGINTENNKWWPEIVKGYQELTAVDPQVKKGLKRTAITDPAIMSQAAAGGEMLDSQFAMFNTFFEGTPAGSNPLDTLGARIKKLTDFTKELYDADSAGDQVNEVTNLTNFKLDDLTGDGLVDLDKTNNKYIDYLNKIMVLDYFNAMAKELDAGAGPYVFEAFCAYLAGGRVAGKETGLKGGMGETDFFFDDGSKGSSKYLRTSNKFTQSVDNFLQGVTVTYVFASKKGETKKGESDPDLIHVIDLYVVDVTRLDQSEEGGEVLFSIKPYGGDAREANFSIKDSQVEFKVDAVDDKVGTVYLVQKDKKSIMANLDKLAEKMDADSSIAYNQFKALTEYFTKTFKHLESAKEKVSEYSNTGTMSLGTAAQKDMSDASTQFQGVMDIVQAKQPTQQIPLRFQESKKITAKHLQKLIEEKFKK